jgi:hypothetical protein
MRTAIIVAGDLFALLLYAVGLISPLTPSEGIPRLWELLVLAAGPLALLAACAHASRTVIGRIVVAVQILGVGSFTGVLLWMQFRTMV